MFDGHTAPGDQVFTAWGTELPPVGMECTVSFSTCLIESDLGYSLRNQLDGKNVEVIAHDVVLGIKVAVFRAKVADRMYTYHSLSAECFSPAKTQRERDIEALVDAIVRSGDAQVSSHVRDRWRTQAEFAYDFIVARINQHGGES